MCYNTDISIKTFLFGLISAIIIYLYDYKYLPIIIIIMSFTSMQLLEYFAWTYINKKKIIKILSYIGFFIILLQYIIIYYISLPEKYKIISVLIIILYGLYKLLISKNNFTMIIAKNGHLRWRWIETPIYWLILLLILYLTPLYFYNKLIFYFGTITAIISLYSYYNNKTFGSMWCYFSNLLWIIFLISILFNLNIIENFKTYFNKYH